MGAEPEHLLDSMTSRYAMARSFLVRLSTFVGQVTFKIKRGAPAETIEEIGRKWKLDNEQRHLSSSAKQKPARRLSTRRFRT